jgi:hypothetical protein
MAVSFQARMPPLEKRPFRDLSDTELNLLRHKALVSPLRDVQLVIDIATERHLRLGPLEDNGTVRRK